MSMSILSSKLLLISVGVVSLAVGFKSYVPFTVDEIPVIWSIVMSWMKPPYLYVIINAIIVVIIVSSRFHWSLSETSSVRSEQLISVKTPPPSYYESLSAKPEIASVVQESMAAAASAVYDGEDREIEVKPVAANGSIVVFETEEAVAEDKDVLVDSMLTYDPPPQEMVSPELPLEFLLTVREKPLVSSRFGHRKPIRTIPEGVRALKVAKPKRQETLESTWKMITEGRHVPLTRHTKKSDAWEHHVTSTPPYSDDVAASENFQERTSNLPPPAAAPSGGRIRKEPSLGHDELNRRVEAFIKKFNEDMRMQRQESLDQYREMMQRGL
ncbi:hypothetical protein F511_29690 [Dorcoceras hygrometricum]|uniref:DUF4408 domain-containing protein n=1 Tax=Dorcoceras hygrometricum TaxID=472368 RepID=A0A2Z7CUW3_9LAMI|nr:hypothetical protein F511_29690 [Dorcoceras hygrometricum]